jgi:LysR family transcriptional regulator of gallate degradation
MPTVSFRHARIVLAVARNASVTGAAKAINRSQTSVTKSIQDLERDLGVTLFDRSPRGVSLTAYGETLYRGALQAAEAFEQASGLVAPIVAGQSPGVARFWRRPSTRTCPLRRITSTSQQQPWPPVSANSKTA